MVAPYKPTAFPDPRRPLEREFHMAKSAVCLVLGILWAGFVAAVIGAVTGVAMAAAYWTFKGLTNP